MSDDHGLEAARSQFEKIAGLVLALQSADVFAREDAEKRIHEDALKVMIRSSWHEPGSVLQPGFGTSGWAYSGSQL